jgi:hypothetical protein
VIQCAFNKKTLTKLTKRTNKVYGTSIPDASIIKDISDRNITLNKHNALLIALQAEKMAMDVYGVGSSDSDSLYRLLLELPRLE